MIGDIGGCRVWGQPSDYGVGGEGQFRLKVLVYSGTTSS